MLYFPEASTPNSCIFLTITVYYKKISRKVKEHDTKQPSETRNCALVVVRIFAFFSVVSIHFFSHAGYYNATNDSIGMYCATLTRTFFRVCVPLFIILSGYLMGKKSPSASYYKKIIPILAEYFLASMCCAIFNYFQQGMPAGIFLFGKTQLLGLFSYSTAPYGWYVEMYIGLFLLIPYLNILYNNLGTKSSKQSLIVTMLVITSIPSITNSLSFDLAGEAVYFRMLPQWWTGIYPITYYFIGTYLREYPIQFSNTKNILLILLATLISGSFCYWKCYQLSFDWGIWQTNESIFTVIQALLVFSFLLQLPYTRLTKYKNILSYLSGRCFVAYLVSSILDSIVYPILSRFFNMDTFRLELFAIAVPAVFIGSLALSTAIHGVSRFTARIFMQIKTIHTH